MPLCRYTEEMGLKERERENKRTFVTLSARRGGGGKKQELAYPFCVWPVLACLRLSVLPSGVNWHGLTGDLAQVM